MTDILCNNMAPVIPERFNLAAHVLAAGRDSDVALEVIGGAASERWSYKDMRSAVGGAAGLLATLGLKPGARVLMRLGNTVDFPVCYLAAIAAGLVPVVTSAQLTSGEVAEVVRQTSPAIAVQADDVAQAEVRSLSVPALRASFGSAPFQPIEGDPNRPAYIVFTSGTSGRPRAVVHAHRAILARQMMIRDWYALTPQDRLCHAGAFNWTFTLGTGLMDPWSLGATALILEAGTDLAALPDLLAKHDVSIFAAAPGVYRRVLRAADRIDAPSLRHGLSAGEKLPEMLRARWRAATGTDIHEAFGMSECSTFISGAPHRPAAAGALGAPQRGRQVALVGPLGPVSHGEEGEIAVHASDPGLMLGYLDAPDETAARYQGDWFLTGDRGAMDAEGQITYLGRADDMMNAGGFRVSPVEVEQAMAQHPAITDCAAVECAVGPETKVIALVYTGTATPDTDLGAFAARHLARYKQPRIWRHVQGLPRGANNKLLRRAVRAQLESEGHR